MGRVSVNDADNYGGQGGSGFFSLKSDKDVARVRFLINGIDDVNAYIVHEAEVDGKKRWVDCLREYGDPVDACPFCKAGRYTNVKYFIPLYNIDAGTTQVWERGKQFGSKLSSICARYPNLVSHILEIERNGKKGDTHTTYEIYETGDDGTTLDQFEVKDPLGTIILQKTADEMEAYLQTGDFESAGVTRRGSTGNTANTETPPFEGGYQRRTPSRGRGEAF